MLNFHQLSTIGFAAALSVQPKHIQIISNLMHPEIFSGVMYGNQAKLAGALRNLARKRFNPESLLRTSRTPLCPVCLDTGILPETRSNAVATKVDTGKSELSSGRYNRFTAPLRSSIGITGWYTGELVRGTPAMSGLITAPANIWLAVKPVDMRKGIDGLSVIIQEALGQAPGSGSAFIFRNLSGNRLKVIIWDGNGVWLCHRRLHKGGFVWPSTQAASFSLTVEQWHWLITGVDWRRLSATPQAEWCF
jgi:transposase